jgi:hypothetical protein
MNLYIEIENGQTKNHPAFEDNLIQAFGSVPENWEAFVRVEKPQTTLYEVLDIAESGYKKVDGVWKDVWVVRQMTESEKVDYQNTYKTSWAALPNRENFSAWVFDETTCKYQPPITRPEPDQIKLDAGIRTVWCGADNNWKDTPVCPEGNYKFDFFVWQWIEVE